MRAIRRFPKLQPCRGSLVLVGRRGHTGDVGAHAQGGEVAAEARALRISTGWHMVIAAANVATLRQWLTIMDKRYTITMTPHPVSKNGSRDVAGPIPTK